MRDPLYADPFERPMLFGRAAAVVETAYGPEDVSFELDPRYERSLTAVLESLDRYGLPGRTVSRRIVWRTD